MLAVGSVSVRGVGDVAHHNPNTVQVRKREFSGSGHFDGIDMILSRRDFEF